MAIVVNLFNFPVVISLFDCAFVMSLSKNPFVVSLSNHALGGEIQHPAVSAPRKRRGSTGSPQTGLGTENAAASAPHKKRFDRLTTNGA